MSCAAFRRRTSRASLDCDPQNAFIPSMRCALIHRTAILRAYQPMRGDRRYR